MPPHHHEIEKVRPHVDYLLIHLIFFAPDGINGNFVLKKGEKSQSRENEGKLTVALQNMDIYNLIYL
jgi:hypothetical protein